MASFVLTPENYFSCEANTAYMSNSQFKSFMACPAATMAELQGAYSDEDKPCYLEGHMFEASVCGRADEFLSLHPEVVSSRGATKGELKASFQRIANAAEAFMRHEAMMDELRGCEQQKILTCVIAGVPFKCALDLYNPDNGNCWDTKCVKDFNPIWSSDEGRRLRWWEFYYYHYQQAIYREALRQNGYKTGRFGLMAATKEETPNVAWLVFADQLLDNALDIICELAPTYQAIKIGMIDADACGACKHCRSTKIITEPEIIYADGDFGGDIDD